MRRLVLSVAALVAAVVFAGVLAGCSGSDFDSNEVSNVKILTKHVKLNVGSDSLIPTRASDKQSRFETILPPDGVGTIKYRFTKGEILHAFTKIAGDKFQKSDLTCTEVDSVTGKASFEGDLKYTEGNQDVYLWLGRYLDWGGTNVLVLNDNSRVSPVPFYGQNLGFGVYNNNTDNAYAQYGRTTISSIDKSLNIPINMVAALATIKVNGNILNALEYGSSGTQSLRLSFSAPPKMIKYFNLESGNALTYEFSGSVYIQKYQIADIINNYDCPQRSPS